MDTLWTRGACSIREIQEAFPAKKRPAFTTIQTTVYRLEGKKALRCTKRIGKANIFEAVISRELAESRLIDDLLDLLGGRGKPVMAHLVNSGSLTIDDIKDAEETLRQVSRKGKTK
jgi:predicted transcriptional regulator